MNRRTFAAVLAAAVVLPWPAVAQDKTPVVGVLVLGSPDPAPFLKVFRESLEALGHVEGRTLRLDIRSAGGDARRLDELAAAFVRNNVDVIVAWQTPAVAAAKGATRDIPIVMAGAGNPVGTGLIASLARPGGNITGNSGVGAELAAKIFEVIRDVLPAARRVAVLANATDPFTTSMLAQIRPAAQALGLEAVVVSLRPDDPLAPAFEHLRGQAIDAVFVQPTLLRQEAVDLANAQRLPSFSFNRVLADSGGLASYTPNFPNQYRGTAQYVDRILKGGRPSEMPVSQPTKFDLVINLRTARAIGVTVPPAVLLRADEVIE
jgi:putative ABC transport system substrate-binding protein